MSQSDINELHKHESMPAKRKTWLAIVCLILGIIIFVIAYLGMNHGIGLGQYNQPILSWVVEHRVDSLVTIAKIITSIGGTIFLTALTAIIITVWMIKNHEFLRPILLASSMAIAIVTSLLMKIFIMDARPMQNYMVPTFEIDYSFPSGHTIATIVFLLVFGYLVYSRYFKQSKQFIWLSVAFLGGGIIALTRLYLGYHWLTDVTASIGLGLIILAVIITADKLLTRLNKFS